MKSLMRTCLLGAIIGLSFLTIGPTRAQADDYWDGYWGWYDNTYRPYYYRQYYRSPYYGGAYYGPSYYGPSYYGGAYYGGYPSYGYYGYPGYRYGGAYYGTPNIGYRDFGGGGGQVRVGPVQFGWR